MGRRRQLPDACRGAQAFQEDSDDEYQHAEYRVDKEAREIGGADKRERAKFWEIWDKTRRPRLLGQPGL